VKAVYELAEELARKNGVATYGACVFHAIAANQILGAKIVAGSLSWKFTSLDDGSNPTHFSYIFEPHKMGLYLARGILPEMHVWNTWDKQTLDLTTKYMPEQAMRLCGFRWEPSLLPPEYFHGESEGKDHLYKPDMLATRFILERISSLKR